MSKKTIIVFSGDYDKLIAAFIIANGAAAMDDEVTMFFTFWGLCALRKPHAGKSSAPKTFLQKMFSGMLPHQAEKLPLTKFHFRGMGRGLMKRVMKSKNVMSVQELMDSAREQGVKLIACTMSMDVLGIDKEDLIDGIEYAGVATYLAEADEGNVNLFI